MRTEQIRVGDVELVIERPESPESLIDEERFAEDEFLPYWAELWPSGLALASHVAGLDLSGRRVLELGCGLALPSLAAASGGADVLATDWAEEALELVVANAAANRVPVATALVDWQAPPPGLGQFDVVLAADVLYEARNAVPVLAMLEATTAAKAVVLLADPGRRHAPLFFDRAADGGWSIDQVAAPELPSGRIATLRRATSAPGHETLC